jgi:hypothetical protein
MSSLVFLPEAWADYIYWQSQDKKTLRKINQLLQDISRDNFVGIGKPEPLKGDMAGWMPFAPALILTGQGVPRYPQLDPAPICILQYCLQ